MTRTAPAPRAFVLVVVLASIVLANLDLFIVNVALPELGRSFARPLADLSWVLNAYAIAFAALLVVAGRLGDRTGQRRLFLQGLALFTLGSAACAAAPNLELLVTARVVQATGAAALMPTSLALLLAVTEPDRRAAAVRAWAAVGGLAAALGPVAGGVLASIDWRWVFLVNVPLGIGALVLGARVLPHPEARAEEVVPDLVGAGLLTVGTAALVGGVVQAPERGWGDPVTGTLLAAGLLLLAWFVARCRTHPRPLVEPSLLRIPGFARANVALALFGVAFAMMLLSSMLWMQTVWGYGALRAGLALVPGPSLVPVIALLVSRHVNRLGAGRVAAAGTALFAAGLVSNAVLVSLGPAYLASVLPGMLLTGAGVGLALPTMMGAGAATLPAARFGTGTALLTTSRQLAAAVGVATLVTVLGRPSTPAATQDAFVAAWLVAAVLMAGAGVVALGLGRSRPGAAPLAVPATSAPLATAG